MRAQYSTPCYSRWMQSLLYIRSSPQIFKPVNGIFVVFIVVHDELCVSAGVSSSTHKRLQLYLFVCLSISRDAFAVAAMILPNYNEIVSYRLLDSFLSSFIKCETRNLITNNRHQLQRIAICYNLFKLTRGNQSLRMINFNFELLCGFYGSTNNVNNKRLATKIHRYFQEMINEMEWFDLRIDSSSLDHWLVNNNNTHNEMTYECLLFT